ncbi:MAG: hypothetical protein V3T83_00785 [Acidobacteriota bacterium]
MDFRPSPLVGCALGQEVTALRRYGGRPCRFVATGLGARRTSASLTRLFEKERPPFFIFTGTAGQLDPDRSMGEVLLPRFWSFEDGQRFAAGLELLDGQAESGWSVCEMGLTVAKPVFRPQTRLHLFRHQGASICDLESAAVLQTAARFGIPCLAPKVVSDTAESGMTGFYTEFSANLKKLARYLDRLLDHLAAHGPHASSSS